MRREGALVGSLLKFTNDFVSHYGSTGCASWLVCSGLGAADCLKNHLVRAHYFSFHARFSFRLV